MKTTHGTHLVEVSVEPDEATDGNSKVHHIEIKFDNASALSEIVVDDHRVSFTVTGQWEWTDLQACLKAHFG